MKTIEEERELFRVLWSSEFAPTLQEFSIDLSYDHYRPTRKVPRDEFELDSMFSGYPREAIAQKFKSESLTENGKLLKDDYESEQRLTTTEGTPSILNFKGILSLWLKVNFVVCLC